MKRINLFTILTLFISGLIAPHTVSSQDQKVREMPFHYSAEQRVRDSLMAMRVPLVTMPDGLADRDLPAVVDNTQHKFWSGIRDQMHFFTCQQYAMTYVIGYELNRLRDLEGWRPENSYPPHFTWNFMNNGDRYTGVNFLETFEAVRQQGHPTGNVYGPDTTFSVLGWPNGYLTYYDGMENRISRVRAIDVSSAIGIVALKNYLYDHLDGSPTGGIGCFTTSSSSFFGMVQFPPGTPEEGKNVVVWWDSSPNHGLTVVGYNDSVRVDINQDGRYTNDLDITGDGIVDARDWEFGAFRIANSYGTWWSNEGYLYAMYRSFALGYESGGIWNNRVYVVDADTTYKPLLTASLNLEYNLRQRIRIRAGVSTDTLHNIPEYTMDFPFFNFQGGDHAMQGIDSIPEYKEIEIGLDITPLLNFVEPDRAARFFIIVEERDPDHTGRGKINNGAFIRYYQGPVESPFEQVFTEIEDNNVTLVSAVVEVVKPPLHILNQELPPYITGENYQVQLEAVGGTPPYQWSVDKPYSVRSVTRQMPANKGTYILGHYEYRPFEIVPLPFSFPFAGALHDTVYVSHYGFVTFRPDYMPGIYTTDEIAMLKITQAIAPAFSLGYSYQSFDNDGIWALTGPENVVIRWQASVQPYYTSSSNDFALVLFPDGRIEFRYGLMENTGFQHAIHYGVSAGEGMQFDLRTNWDADSFSGTSLLYAPPVLPDQFSLSPEGLLTVGNADPERIYDLPVRVTDAGRLSDVRSFLLAGHLLVEHELISGSGNQFTKSEPASLRLTLKNNGPSVMQNLVLRLKSTDSLSVVTDSMMVVSSIGPGETAILSNVFEFMLSGAPPDKEPVTFELTVTNGTGVMVKSLIFRVAAFNLLIDPPSVIDGADGKMEPGEVAELMIPVRNTGSLDAVELELSLSCNDTLISFLTPVTTQIPVFSAASIRHFSYLVKVSRSTPLGHEIPIMVTLTGDQGINLTVPCSIKVGRVPVALVNLASSTASRDAMMESLDSLKVTYDTIHELPVNYDQYDCVFLILGSNQQSHTLTMYEAGTLADYLKRGGNLYMEGNNTWYYLSNTPLHPMFMYNSVKIPVYFYPVAAGVNGTLAEGMTFDFNSTVDYALFSFEPKNGSVRTMVNGDNPPKGLEIAYDGQGYRTIGTFLDYGFMEGIDTNSTRLKLMKRYLDFFGLNITGPHALFHTEETVVCTGRQVVFHDDSYDGITSRLWEFEGGNPATSTGNDPVVVYAQPGTFDVRLTVSDGTNTRSITKTRYIDARFCTATGEQLSSRVRLYPNPASDIVTVELSGKLPAVVTTEIIHPSGARILNQQHSVAGNKLTVNLSGISPGLYLIRVSGESFTVVEKIMKH